MLALRIRREWQGEAAPWDPPPRSVKILHVLSALDRGGAELSTLRIVRKADCDRYQSDFCTLSGRLGALDKEVEALGGRMYPLPVRRIGFSRRFRALVREHRFDVVHSHIHFASGYILRLAARAGVPIRIAFFHSSHDGRNSGILRRSYRRLMRHWIQTCATHVLANSRATMDSTWGPGWKTDERCHVVYLGVSPSALPANGDPWGVRREFGIPSRSPLYVHVGRLVPPKNHHRLISIFGEVVKRQPAARLLVVGPGDGPSEQGIRRRIAELGLVGRAFLCGERTDVPRLLASADLMIFPSRWEGLGLAVLEACAAGTPVVATNLACIREIAARLPSIRCLSLDDRDTEWARWCIDMAAGFRARSQRETARRRFAASPFTLDRSVDQICRSWRGLIPSTPCETETDG